MMDDIVAQLAPLVPDLNNRVSWPAPISMPAALSVWLDYGPVEVALGMTLVKSHTITATVAIPYPGSDYANRYRSVTDTAQLVSNLARPYTYTPFGGEGVIAAERGVTVGKAGTFAFAGEDIIAALVTFVVETKSDITA